MGLGFCPWRENVGKSRVWDLWPAGSTSTKVLRAADPDVPWAASETFIGIYLTEFKWVARWPCSWRMTFGEGFARGPEWLKMDSGGLGEREEMDGWGLKPKIHRLGCLGVRIRVENVMASSRLSRRLAVRVGNVMASSRLSRRLEVRAGNVIASVSRLDTICDGQRL